MASNGPSGKSSVGQRAGRDIAAAFIAAGGAVLAALIGNRSYSAVVVVACLVVVFGLLAISVRRWSWEPLLIGVVVTVVIGGVFVMARLRQTGAQAGGVQPPPVPSGPSKAPDVPFALTVAIPRPGQTVPVRGTTVSGSFTGDLENRRLLVFKFVSNKRQQFLGDELSVSGSRFGGSTGQIGSNDQAEVGQIYKVEVVAVDSQTADLISKTKPNTDGDVVFDGLPSGTTVVGEVDVVRG